MKKQNAKLFFSLATTMALIFKHDKEMHKALLNKELKIIDHEIFHVVKATGAGNIIAFSQKSENMGAVSNVHQGRLSPNNAMVVTSIIICSAVSAAANSTIADAAALDFKTLTPILRNARFSLDIGAEKAIADSSCEIFAQYDPNVAISEFVLDAPRLIMPSQEIKLEISQLGAALPAETWVKVIFRGGMTFKN